MHPDDLAPPPPFGTGDRFALIRLIIENTQEGEFDDFAATNVVDAAKRFETYIMEGS